MDCFTKNLWFGLYFELKTSPIEYKINIHNISGGRTPYKVQLVQELKAIVHPMRFRFAKWVCDRLTEDKAHFDRGGYVNKQNCCIWGHIKLARIH